MAQSFSKHFRLLLFALLVGITAFSVVKYLAALKERYDLISSINQIKQQVAVLEEEKKGLQQDLEKEQALKNQISQDNASLKESLRLSDEKLAALVHDLSEAHKNLEEISAQISIVTAENTALKEDFTRTKARLEEESRQKDELAARFNSITELKKAIKDLRKRMRQARQLAAPLRPSKKAARAASETKIIDGNRGYLIKDGKPTTPTKVKIEVITLP